MTENKLRTVEQRLSLRMPWKRPAAEGEGTPLRRPIVILAALAVVLSVTAGLLWFSNSARADKDDARSDALAAARKNVATLLSYDYRTISTAVDERAALVTGDFKSDYADLVNDQVAPAARKRKVVTRTDVVTAAVVSADTDQARLLLFLNQVSATKQSKVPLLTGSRVRVEMRKVDGTWRVADVTPL
jgi:Mce-associated membrane protein